MCDAMSGRAGLCGHGCDVVVESPARPLQERMGPRRSAHEDHRVRAIVAEPVVFGAYQHLSTKYLVSYLDELEWRYNNHRNPHLLRDTSPKVISSDTLWHHELVPLCLVRQDSGNTESSEDTNGS
jgi:hypothetical protein